MPDSHLKDKIDTFSFLLYSKCLYFSKVKSIFKRFILLKIQFKLIDVSDVALLNLTLKIVKIYFFKLFPELDIKYSFKYVSLSNPKTS